MKAGNSPCMSMWTAAGDGAAPNAAAAAPSTTDGARWITDSVRQYCPNAAGKGS